MRNTSVGNDLYLFKRSPYIFGGLCDAARWASSSFFFVGFLWKTGDVMCTWTLDAENGCEVWKPSIELMSHTGYVVALTGS